MYWPDTQTGVDTEPPRKPVASAVRKFFTEGGVGQPPTVPGGDWFNQMTNEVLSVLEAAGIEPSKVDDDQLLQAINLIVISKTSEITGRYAYSGRSLYDLLTPSELARIASDDRSLDLTEKLQQLIDEQKPFHLIPNVRHYCNGHLQMKSGAKIKGAGCGTNQQPTDESFETAIIFNQETTDVGFQLSSASGWVTDWDIDGVTIGTIDNADAINTFTTLNTTLGHQGCYGFKLNCYILGAKFGANIDTNFWNGDLDLRVAYCYKPFVRTASSYSTSLSGWIKSSFCFHGVDMSQLTYCPLNFWFDQCGKSAPSFVVSSAPVDELPILMKITNSVALTGTVGVEKSNAQFINASAYSSAKFFTHYFSDPDHFFLKDEDRQANVPLANQGLIYCNNSQLSLGCIVASHLVENGYPPASLSDPTYFCIPGGTDQPRITFSECFINMQEYCVCPSGAEKYISAQSDVNGSFRFGATSVNAPMQSVDWVGGLLRFGSKSVQPFHQIKRFVPFIEGEKFLELGGASFAANVEFKSVNGSSGSNANSAMRVPAALSTSRSINAGGTINASGADYAEYIKKNRYCGVIEKGAICGVDVNGELTDRYDDAISFVIKSTSPAYVGGDTWFDEEPPVPPSRDSNDTEMERYRSEFKSYSSRLESARLTVDRVAFCGQVPVNSVISFNVGDYIVPSRLADGSIGASAVSLPEPFHYRISVGRVCRVGDDGRPIVIVKVV